MLAPLEVRDYFNGGQCGHAGLPVLCLSGHCCFCGIIWGDWALDVDWCVQSARMCCCMSTFASRLFSGQLLALTTAAADLMHQCILSLLLHRWSQRCPITNLYVIDSLLMHALVLLPGCSRHNNTTQFVSNIHCGCQSSVDLRIIGCMLPYMTISSAISHCLCLHGTLSTQPTASNSKAP